MSTNKQKISHLYFGLDLGKRQDYSALAVIEYAREFEMVRNPVNWALDQVMDDPTYSIRHLDRIPLGTKYTEVALRVQQMLVRAAQKNHDCTLIVDATGVGQPVVEMFYGLPRRATLIPVVITGGETESRTKEEWRVPKQDLLAGLQLMLESETLAIAEGLQFSRALEEELIAFRGSFRKKRSDDQPADRYTTEREHDDLVLAVALATWRARRHDAGLPGFRNLDPGIQTSVPKQPPSVWGKVRLL
jgi:hypothetical protein